MTHPSITTTAAATGALIVLPDRASTLRWSREHTERLVFVLSRAELRAGWKATGLGEIHHRTPRRKKLAAVLARHDAQTLTRGEEDLPWLIARRAAAAARVAAVGTATWWAGAHVDGATPCPLRPPATPEHVWDEMDPACRYCAVVIGPAEPVDRAVLAGQVWEQIGGYHKLSREQVASAIGALGDRIDARRGLAVTGARARASSATGRSVMDRNRKVTGCGHLWVDADPTCQRCAAMMATISPYYSWPLADVVWAHVAHRYGLSLRQSDAALGAMRELISQRRRAKTEVYDPWMR